MRQARKDTEFWLIRLAEQTLDRVEDAYCRGSMSWTERDQHRQELGRVINESLGRLAGPNCSLCGGSGVRLLADMDHNGTDLRVDEMPCDCTGYRIGVVL